ncbi:MAG: protein-disulfide reductase DsbD family protein [Planctomycetota bacterium]
MPLPHRFPGFLRRGTAALLVLVGLAGVGSAEDIAQPLAKAARPALANPLADVTAALGDPVRIEARIEPGSGTGPDVLAVTAALEDGWHLYAVTQQPGGPIATRVTVAGDSVRKVAGPFVPDVEPHRRTVDDVPAWQGLVIEEHSGRVTWRAPLASGTGEVRGAVRLQLCQDTTCLPPQSIPFTATVATPPATAGQAFVEHAPPGTHVTVRAAVGPPVGGATPLVVHLVPADGWHLYRPADSAASAVGQGKPTIVSTGSGGESAPARVRVTRMTPTTHAELVEAGAVDGPVALEIGFPPDAAAAREFLVGFQTCSTETCDPPAAVRVTVTSAGEITFASARYGEAATSVAPLAGDDPAPPATPPAIAAAPATASMPVAPAPAAISLPVALLMGLAGGLILNLMPCVLPVLGLKLMSFAQQSGRARREVFQMNLWYCAGVFAVFFVLATASVAANLGLGRANLAWGEQFTSAGFNIAMIGIVFAFALSFLGIWELPIPGFIGEKAGHVQTQEGPAGAFLKGVLSTVLATPCSGPFLGPVFGFTLTQPTAVTYAVFGAIATGMCLPYLLVGLMPGLVRMLPKPGAWMGTFKEVLGFVMLGTVVYLFTILHHEWFVPTLALLVGIWAACWWIGKGQEASGAVGFGRWLQAGAVLAAVGWGAFRLLAPGESLIEWQQPFSRDRIAELRRSGATVMVDFSADWCPTCKYNLAYAIETDRVKSLVDLNRVVPVLADWTDDSDEIKQALEGLQSRSIPVLAIYPAATPGGECPEPIVLRDLITEAQVLEALEMTGPSKSGASPIRSASTGRSGGR